MAFVRKKRVGTQTYYHLVESYRHKGKKTPRQRMLMYLGKNPTVEDAIADWSQRAKEYRRRARELRDRSSALENEIEEWEKEQHLEKDKEGVDFGEMRLQVQLLIIEVEVRDLDNMATVWEKQVEQLRAAAHSVPERHT